MNEIDLKYRVNVRPAVIHDLHALAELIDEAAIGHPAEKLPRSLANLQQAYFGEKPVGEQLLAVTIASAIGFAGWTKIYDPSWSVFGGQVIGMYVQPAYRGKGIAAMLIAALCARVREAGGQYLWSEYDERLAQLYERVLIGKPCREGHLSGEAFQQIADLAGKSVREIVRGLPELELNMAPPLTRTIR